MPRGGPRPGAGRKPKPTATTVDAEPRRPFFSEHSVEAILRAVQERQLSSRRRPRTAEWNPYIIRPDRFGPVAEHVKKNAPKMAMDKVRGLARDNEIAIQAWQAGGLLGNLVSEGLLFLGYPYLSELAQRPEFRLFGEIRAQEMTRKWIEFRPVTDDSTKDKDAENEGKKQKNPDDDERAREKRQAGDEAPRTDDRNKEIEDKIKELNDAMDDFRVRDWFESVAAQDSFFGIAHLYLDIKGTDLENQRDPELPKSIGNGRDKVSKNKLARGCLKGLRTIEPIWCYPTTYNAQNPLIETWYDPQVWYVMGAEIHKTRLLPFVGRPVPDILKPAYAFGGLAMTQMAQPYVDIWLRTRESVGELIHAFSTMVMMTNLGTTTMPGGSGGGGGDVLARLALFNALRDNQGVFAIDKNTEDFKNVAAPLSGLDELQAQAQEHMFSVGRIPAVKFAGIQPKGLNATSEGEMKAFYDTIVGEQNHLFRPHLRTISDIVQIHLWGACDHDITFDFVPLEEQTQKEKAEIRKMDAETAQILIDSGQISQEEARRRLATDPESGYHEIDPDDVPDLLEEEEMGLAPPGARGLEGIIGGEGEDPAGGEQKGSRVTPFAGSRRKAAGDEFRESEHPRDPDGKFSETGSSGGAAEPAVATSENSLEQLLTKKPIAGANYRRALVAHIKFARESDRTLAAETLTKNLIASWQKTAENLVRTGRVDEARKIAEKIKQLGGEIKLPESPPGEKPPVVEIEKPKRKKDALKQLADEYVAWQKEQGLTNIGSASEEQFNQNLSSEQRAWLSKFSRRWEIEQYRESVRKRRQARREGRNRREENLRPFVEKTLKEESFPAELVSFVSRDRTFKLNGRSYKYAGAAYRGTGKIELFTSQLNNWNIVPILKHEIMHQKWNAFQQAAGLELMEMVKAKAEAGKPLESSWEPEGWREKYPLEAIRRELSENFEDYRKDDGVTSYSRKYWEQLANNENLNNRASAVHETLAEMATEVARGNPLPGSQRWKKLYESVNANWKKHGASKGFSW